MADHELLPLLQEYLAASSLDGKDRLLRRMRVTVESLPAGEESGTLRILEDIRKTQQGHPEGEGLLLLLAGYHRSAGFDLPGAEEAFERVIARNAGNPAPAFLYLTCRAELGRVLHLSERGLDLQALQQIETLKPLLEKLALPALSGEARNLQARALRRLGRTPEALGELDQALALFRQDADEYGVAAVEETRGLAALDLGRMDEAELYLQRALARRTRLDDRLGLARALGSLGRYFAGREQDDQAAEYLQKELDLCEEAGYRKGWLAALQGLARIALRAGQWDRARDCLERAAALVRRAGSRISEAHLALVRADYHLARGEAEEAELLHRKTRDLFGPRPGDLIQAQLELQAARIAAGRGERAPAEEKFARAREIFRNLQRPSALAQVEFDWGVWLAREDRLEEAAPHIAQAIAQARSFEADRMAERFASACESIASAHWLQALCRVKEMSETLAAEKARFHKMAEMLIHDLKNKVIVLNLALKRAEAKRGRGGDFLSHLALVQGQGLYMENLLKSYLQGLRVDEGHAPDTGQAVDLDAALGEMREAFSVPLQEKGLELIVHSRPTGMQLKSNHLFLRLILFNLLDNAIQYTPRGRGPVSLEARKEGQTVRIAISDRGDGIPEHLQERIFQKWGRCERDEAAYSTGLGLYHAKTMTEALGGRIGVESLVGRGSTFWLKVPLA